MICPICKTDFSGPIKVLGVSNKEFKQYHIANFHVKPLLERVQLFLSDFTTVGVTRPLKVASNLLDEWYELEDMYDKKWEGE